MKKLPSLIVDILKELALGNMTLDDAFLVSEQGFVVEEFAEVVEQLRQAITMG